MFRVHGLVALAYPLYCVELLWEIWFVCKEWSGGNSTSYLFTNERA